MMTLQRARSADEYADWIQQARFEIEDLRNCIAFDYDDLAQMPVFLEPLQEGIEQLYQAMRQGTYHFGRDDLPFMDLVVRFSDAIPFYLLLQQINETHRHGLDVTSH
jgi:hypothetical protein